MAYDLEEGELYVANIETDSLTVYDGATYGNVTPLRAVNGPNTALSSPFGIALDAANDELIASNLADYALRIYSAVALGDIAALRALDGPDTGLNYPSDVAVISSAAAPDGDGDGIADDGDNCPFYASADLADADGDGRGNVCECGDQNGDGRSTVSDLVAINLAIFNPGLATALCDANGDSLCNVSDIVSTNVEIFSPGNTSTCARQPVPGP
jgi:hypothetical protein